TGGEIAKHSAEAGAAEDRHGNDTRREQGHSVAKIDPASLVFHEVPAPDAASMRRGALWRKRPYEGGSNSVHSPFDACLLQTFYFRRFSNSGKKSAASAARRSSIWRKRERISLPVFVRTAPPPCLPPA